MTLSCSFRFPERFIAFVGKRPKLPETGGSTERPRSTSWKRPWQVYPGRLRLLFPESDASRFRSEEHAAPASHPLKTLNRQFHLARVRSSTSSAFTVAA